ncbi:bromodomain-containing protein [Tieghemostelium lacteum]|uniref:histone acetyltransferase n=1 Tax=Tieghemostelium lacteum TaxID=361077 RepID=A0A151ZGQ8_TIELA|nr:bromodomain-containing protein [Tieghemostelium lacteum]|eukprot:KYQ93060.1 bromodomain-containing protein [Tieghemostelium lacteum]
MYNSNNNEPTPMNVTSSNSTQINGNGIIPSTTTTPISTNGTTFHEPVVIPVEQNKQVPLGPEGGLEPLSTGRDLTAKQEKEKGILRFEVVTNNGELKNLQQLMNLKNVFSKQLPKMPREYIVRLMFDRFHHSLLIIKREVVIGGICFRPFKEQGFIEIAFCAITSNEQVKGYGSFLMTHLKEHNRTVTGIHHFLTFADNFAIEYFQKQGFTHEVTLAREKWKGFIQEYDGGSLMECVIHPNVPYLDIASMVKLQRETLNKKIREISTSHIVYPGIQDFKHGQRRIAIENIKGIEGSGWVSTVDNQRIQQLQIKFEKILELVKAHPDAWPFLQPVSIDDAPNYYNIVKDPVDLQKIAERLALNQYYITENIFQADLKRMCNNCREFNQEGSVYYEIADRLEKFIVDQIKNIDSL